MRKGGGPPGRFFVTMAALLPMGLLWYCLGYASELRTAGAADCSFQNQPGEFAGRDLRMHRELSKRSQGVGASLGTRGEKAVAASTLPVRNFIDAEIFGRLSREGVPAAPLSSDLDFVRRIHLDLTGRIPAPEAVTEFLADGSPDKRARLVDELMASPEFIDKWTMWMGDWLKNTRQSVNVARQPNGVAAVYRYLRNTVETDRSLRDIAYEAVSTRGNSYDDPGAPANFTVASITPMGPVQDQYDTALANAATTFLGLGYYDCLLCHNGRGHLEEISLWGTSVTRTQAQQMAAFFSRQTISGRPLGVGMCEALESCRGMFYSGSFDVNDRTAGSYALNTGFGNRPNRTPAGTLRALTPVYRETGAQPKGPYWREDFADNLIKDPMLARNLANRLWKAIFNLGLVEPVDALDPARLDPANPPPAPWTLQATHPELLERLAGFLRDVNYQIKPFLRVLVESSAYQLSSRYDGEWSPRHVPLFARHLARRLEGEEVHDAIASATGLRGSYPVAGFESPFEWAMQLPEPVEPRGNQGNALNFMNTFFRGNRDTAFRRQAGSIQQQLALMNDQFVLNRLRVSASPALRAIAGLASNEEAVNRLFLTFLSRTPSPAEMASGIAHLAKASTPAQRNAAVEDLAWVCVNKVEFLFSF